MQKLLLSARLWVVYVAVLVLASPAFAAAPTVYKLPNGLTVVLQEDHTAPVAAFQMWVKVGGSDEPAEKAGIAHVFEHMLFKGTKKREVGQIGREVSAAGGDINAYTANDQTVYHLVLASQYFDTGLDILADAIQNSSFDPVELKKELEVVVEEIRRGEDNPERALHESLDALMYKVHPYGRPVIGTKETVRSITREDVLKFFEEWYVPNNMTLVVVGDFKITQVKAKVAALFKNFKPNPNLKHGRPKEPPQAEIRITQQTQPFQREKIGIGFHVPSIKEDEGYVLDVVSEILTGGSNAPLVDTLVNKLNIATGVFTYNYTPLDPGAFVAGATVEPKDREEVIRQMARILFSFAHGDVPARRVELAKTKSAAAFIYRMETTQGMAGELGYFNVIIGDMKFKDRYLKVINGVTPAQAAAIAKKYLHPDNLSLSIVSPQGAPPADEARLKQIIREEWSAAAKRPAPLQVKSHKVIEGTHVYQYDNGTRLYISADARLPIVNISGGFQGGLVAEPKAQSGIGNFTASMLMRGTENLTREEIGDRLEEISGSFGASIAPDYFTFNLQYVNDRSDGKELDFLSELILRPTFPPEEVETIRKQLLPQFQQREDNLFQIGLLQYLPKMFGDNGYGRMALGERSVVESVKAEDLRKYYEEAFDPASLVVTVVGNVKPDEFAADFARLFSPARSKSAYVRPQLSFPAIAAPVTVAVSKGKAQSHIFYGWKATGVREEDRYALEILNAITAGMGGRLFLQLRDKQSLAYSVTSLMPMRQETGTYLIYLASAPEKVNEALAAIREQVTLLREKGVLEKEVAEAKRYIIGNIAVDRQSRYSRSNSMLSGELNGLGFAFETDVYPKKIEAVTVADVNRVARKYLDPDQYVMVIVK